LYFENVIVWRWHTYDCSTSFEYVIFIRNRFYFLFEKEINLYEVVQSSSDLQGTTCKERRREGMVTEEKRKKIIFLVLSPRPWPDGPNASGWYRRLREPISPLSLLNCDQLWQLFSRGRTILFSTIIYDLDSRITAKYSKRQTSFYSMQVSFRFHPLRCSEILVSPSICTKIQTWRFHRTEEVSNIFPVSWHITHISMAISANLGQDTDHYSAKLVCDHPLGEGYLTENGNSGLYHESSSTPQKSWVCNFH